MVYSKHENAQTFVSCMRISYIKHDPLLHIPYSAFAVDTSRAGKCEQTVRVVSPSGRNVHANITETSANTYNVSYIPNESGQHRIFLTYNSLELPGRHRCLSLFVG